jgi:hypothetical protein
MAPAFRRLWGLSYPVIAPAGVAYTAELGSVACCGCLRCTMMCCVVCCHQVRLPHLESNVANAGRQLVIGTGLGVVCTCFNAPFDVVKSRWVCWGRSFLGACSALLTTRMHGCSPLLACLLGVARDMLPHKCANRADPAAGLHTRPLIADPSSPQIPGAVAGPQEVHPGVPNPADHLAGRGAPGLVQGVRAQGPAVGHRAECGVSHFPAAAACLWCAGTKRPC